VTNSKQDAQVTQRNSAPAAHVYLGRLIAQCTEHRRIADVVQLGCSQIVSAKSLPTLATIVADFGHNLSPKTATVAQKCDSRRFLRQSHFSATVAVFGDSVDRA